MIEMDHLLFYRWKTGNQKNKVYLATRTEKSFTVSSDWFDRFTTHTKNYNDCIRGENASADKNAT